MDRRAPDGRQVLAQAKVRLGIQSAESTDNRLADLQRNKGLGLLEGCLHLIDKGDRNPFGAGCKCKPTGKPARPRPHGIEIAGVRA
jgi:hypothetical protein